MISELILERALDNLEATYLAVGEQGEGAFVERWEGGVACCSRLNHPVSNFAVIRHVSSKQAKCLREWAENRRAFNLYICEGSSQNESRSVLERAGFFAAGKLCLMVGAADSAPAISLRKCGTFEERLEVSRFMARQFFSKQTSYLREAISLATARAPVDLYRNEHVQFLSAAMLHHTVGMVGVYNVCVAATERERGHGSELLAGILGIALENNKLATLQCEPHLEPWYSLRGFQSVGSISVLTLDRKASHAIM